MCKNVPVAGAEERSCENDGLIFAEGDDTCARAQILRSDRASLQRRGSRGVHSVSETSSSGRFRRSAPAHDRDILIVSPPPSTLSY